MKNIHKRLLLLFLPALLLSSCGGNADRAAQSEAGQKTDAALTETQKQDASEASASDFPDHITEETVLSGKTLRIDAETETHGFADAAEVTIAADEEKMRSLAEELLKLRYPEAPGFESAGEEAWQYAENGNTVFEFAVSDSGGFYYMDIPDNINGVWLEMNHLFEYGYITEQVPDGLTLSAEEAAEEAGSFLENDSDFTFRPWNVLAIGGDEGSDRSGYYEISLQAYMDGIPVSVKGEANTRGFYAVARYSDTGLFSMEGFAPFSERERRVLEDTVSPEQIVEAFRGNFDFFCSGETLEVNRIYFEYYPADNGDGSYTLTPVWAFDCVDTRTELETYETEPVVQRYSVLYYAEDGSFCGVYY